MKGVAKMPKKVIGTTIQKKTRRPNFFVEQTNTKKKLVFEKNIAQ